MLYGASQRRPEDEIIAEVGDEVDIGGVFTGDDGLPDDPAEVFVRILDPNGAGQVWRYGSDPALESVVPGEYHLLYVVRFSGRWYWRLWGVGEVTRAHVGTILVQDDPTSAFDDTAYGMGQAAIAKVSLAGVGTVT